MRKRIISLLLAVMMLLSSVLVLASCGNTLSGTYEDEHGLTSFTFKGKNVEIEMFGVSFDATYKIDGDTITFEFEGDEADGFEGENKFNKATQAGTLAPFEINIKALPGASNSVSSISVIYDATVGIDSIESDDNGEKEIYDLTGRKIEKITAPGIYIVNKKKVIVK